MDTARVVGCHGVKQRERERVSGWQEKPAGDSSGVESREGAPKASGVLSRARHIMPKGGPVDPYVL